MEKEIIRLENCLKTMKKCLKIPKVENCVCFSDAFKVLNVEINHLFEGVNNLPDEESKEKIKSLKKEIEEIQKIITKDDKECLGCDPCMASVVFRSYPERLNNLYLGNEL